MIIKAKEIEFGDVIITRYLGIDRMLKVVNNPVQSPNVLDKMYVKVQEMHENGSKVGPPVAQVFTSESLVEILDRSYCGWGDVEYSQLC